MNYYLSFYNEQQRGIITCLEHTTNKALLPVYNKQHREIINCLQQRGFITCLQHATNKKY